MTIMMTMITRRKMRRKGRMIIRWLHERKSAPQNLNPVLFADWAVAASRTRAVVYG